jgi:two-component sensor histidine kinase
LLLRRLNLPVPILALLALEVANPYIVAELRRKQQALERLVTERTAELRSVNTALAGELARREAAEAALRESLAAMEAALTEKEAALATNETLLREVHHRVKNNLQMLCDLLYLRMEGLGDEKGSVLRDTYSRLYAIARLHEQLYQAMQAGEIQLAPYLERLLDGFRSLYPADLALVAGEGSLALDLDRAIHVGRIVNELVTNAIKHAFRGRPLGRVTVGLRPKGEHLELQVCDNGRGLPAGLDLAQARSLGLRIVHILAQRLDAQVAVENHSGGTVFTVTFPLHADPPREPRGG